MKTRFSDEELFFYMKASMYFGISAESKLVTRCYHLGCTNCLLYENGISCRRAFPAALIDLYGEREALQLFNYMAECNLKMKRRYFCTRYGGVFLERKQVKMKPMEAYNAIKWARAKKRVTRPALKAAFGLSDAQAEEFYLLLKKLGIVEPRGMVAQAQRRTV